ncbi:MAG TPA: hypothetical protein VMT75_10965 [Candidatus Saccharimonadales bacterium]|nr:hypothetical protein [Candidatus Saccharimonadales bacterium]
MSTANLPTSDSSTGPALLRELASAARFWEPLRIGYNLVLVGIVVAWVIATWPHFRPALRMATLVPMVFLALMANVCYSAAYLLDVLLQHVTTRFLGQWRWAVWTAGTLFAMLLANYWIADEIFPDVH